jgi:glycosyltransferase involved in cell wall biosynthesis
MGTECAMSKEVQELCCRPMRVAFISLVNHSMNSPGVVDMANKLSSVGCEVTVFSLPESCEGGWGSGINFRQLSGCNQPKLLRYMKWAVQILSSARHKWDLLVGVNEPGAVLAYALAGCGCARAYIPWARELAELREIGLLRKLLLRRVYGTPWIDVCSERAEYRARALGVNCEPVVILNAPCRAHAGHVRRFPSNDAAVLRLLYTGMVSPRVLLEHAFRGIANAHTNVHFRIVGPYRPEYRASLEELGYQLGVAEKIEFVGRIKRDALEGEYANADVGVVFYGNDEHTITNERLCAPNKFFEYISRGIPVICSDNSTLSGWIAVSRAGVFVETSDWRSVAQGLDQLSNNLADYSRNAIAQHVSSWNFETQLSLAFSKLREMDPTLARVATLINDQGS